jgi:two-component system NtrC family sensor kinase
MRNGSYSATPMKTLLGHWTKDKFPIPHLGSFLKKVFLKLKEYGNIPLLECYAGQRNKVFMNILNNAIEAIEEGINNRLLEDFDYSSQILIRTELAESGDIVIRIADNGIGITQKVKPLIFDLFFTTKPVGKGSGLG